MELYTKSKFAQMAGVSRAAITKATGPGAPLELAMVGDKINVDSEAATKYLSGKKARNSGAIQIDRIPENEKKVELPAADTDIIGYEDKTLEQLVRLFGTVSKFNDWLKARKYIAEIHEKEMKIAIQNGELIEREYVKTHILGAMQSILTRLLNDTPSAIASIVIESIKAGETKKNIEKTVHDLISKQIKEMKSNAKKAIENA